MQKRNFLNIALAMTIIVVGYTPSAEATSDKKACWGHGLQDCSDEGKLLDWSNLVNKTDCKTLGKIRKYPFVRWGDFTKDCEATTN